MIRLFDCYAAIGKLAENHIYIYNDLAAASSGTSFFRSPHLLYDRLYRLTIHLASSQRSALQGLGQFIHITLQMIFMGLAIFPVVVLCEDRKMLGWMLLLVSAVAGIDGLVWWRYGNDGV